MSKARFSYYERVVVGDCGQARSLGVADKTGMILGLPEESDDLYHVSLDDVNEAVLISEPCLRSTGVFGKREDIYDGSSVRVSEEGEILGFTFPEDSQ